MKYIEIQNMRKQAAGPEWLQRIGIGKPKEVAPIDPAIHGRLYDNLEDFQAAGFGENLSQMQQLRGNAPVPLLWWDKGSQEHGHIPYTYERYGQEDENNGIMRRVGDSIATSWHKLFPKKDAQPEQAQQAPPPQPVNAWKYTMYKPGPLSADAQANDTGVSHVIYPDELPNTRFARALFAAMNADRPEDLKNSFAVPFRQPLTFKQIMAYQAGDPEYWGKRRAHLQSIDPKYWHAGNLKLSDNAELDALENAVPGTSFASKTPNYNMLTGEITGFSDDALQSWYKNFVKGSGSKKQTARPSFMPALYNSAYAPEALAADAFNHEFNHWLSTGRRGLRMEKYPRFENKYFDPEWGMSWWSSTKPAATRVENPTSLYFTPVQQDWLKKHQIDPYAIDDVEMNQALFDFNSGRYRLRKDMLEHPENQNYSSLSPELRQQFADLPQMIQGGEAGREELDKVMSFYNQNPQFIPMMSEQSRLVGYYDNLKAAIENSTDPAEKMFFQNLMNRFIYNKSYLANNQRPSYTDVQRMMA